MILTPIGENALVTVASKWGADLLIATSNSCPGQSPREESTGRGIP